ncbi:TPA: hypothetical protein SLP51_004278 [Klebsiella aerogenes]|nr:hypothetical protein [Klebsiella aerogenes]
MIEKTVQPFETSLRITSVRQGQVQKLAHLITQGGIIRQRTRVDAGFDFTRGDVIHDQFSI